MREMAFLKHIWFSDTTNTWQPAEIKCLIHVYSLHKISLSWSCFSWKHLKLCFILQLYPRHFWYKPYTEWRECSIFISNLNNWLADWNKFYQRLRSQFIKAPPCIRVKSIKPQFLFHSFCIIHSIGRSEMGRTSTILAVTTTTGK